MAIVTRRYVHRLPEGPNLAIYVDPVNIPTINAQYERPVVDIDYDNAIPGLADDLDNYLAQFDLVPSATASPRQIFNYVAAGAEGATIAIGVPQGFKPRVTANYSVQVTLQRPVANVIKVVTVQGVLGVNGFTVELSAPVEAGDVLCFTVEDLA